MSLRLDTGGRLIDRARTLDFTFNGKAMRGHPGDTLASALLAGGQMLMGRSFKYHRPRGVVASGAEEPNALMSLGTGARFEPNIRATTAELFDGLEAASQNHWPSLDFDIGAINNRLAPFLPAGFYYKTFINPRPLWKHLFEPVIRRSAGLGRAPEAPDADRYEQLHAFADVLVIGGGIAGLAAALAAGRAGARVILVEQTPHWGGRAPVDGVEIDGGPANAWIKGALQELDGMDNVALRPRCMGVGVHDHGYVLAHERITDHAPGTDAPRQRLWRIRAARTIIATGAIERPLSFASNDIPGVMLASAVRDYLVNWAVAPGKRTVIVTNNDDAYRTALALHAAGLKVPVIADARAAADGALPARARAAGIRVATGTVLAGVTGSRHVTGVALCARGSKGFATEAVACDAVAMSGGWSPVVHLWSHSGGKLTWDAAGALFRPDPERPPRGHDAAGFVIAAGGADGALQAGDCAANADAAGARAAREAGLEAAHAAPPVARAEAEAPLEPVWIMPERAPVELREKMWLDFQNDVKVSDIQLAAREGFRSVEHAKRYTTLGMATDQGKLSNINGLAVLADARGEPIPEVGTTTFRPPYTPIPFGAVAGEARGDTFQPIRRTPMHDWHAQQGARWEPVGQWRRPYCYPRAGEDTAAAVKREVRNTRTRLGLLDASTLGKILLRGPDAGRLVDMLYTGRMSALKPGKCRYGLMCNEDGFLMDDGVAARLSDDSFLLHTTSGGAEHVHGWIEDWLQCEWWDWRVHAVNLTEQFAQIAVVGPNARAALEELGGMDVSESVLPFMGWAEGKLGGFDVRLYRISFSGALSYELAVPAAQGRALWDRLLEIGAPLGVMPYGTEALHVMRAEAGFIMIGDETDGTVTPRDLGLDWAISGKKDDFLGKRGMARSHLTDPERWKLVGLETLEGQVLPDGAYAVAAGRNANGQRNTEGRVTSSYHSPTLGRGIAMGLVRRGPERMGEVIEFATTKGTTIKARIVPADFLNRAAEAVDG